MIYLFLNNDRSSAKLFFLTPNHINEKIPVPTTIAEGVAIATIVNGLVGASLNSPQILHELSY